MKAIKEKLKQRYFKSSPDIVEELLKQCNVGGFFENIDYWDESRSNWQARGGLAQTALLAQAYGYDAGNPFYQSEELASIIRGQMEYWFLHDFHNSNWWQNDLGVPQQLRIIALYMEDALDEEIRNKIFNRLQDGVDAEWTGANRVWFAENVIFKGVLTGNGELIRKGIDCILGEIYIADGDKEGIKDDFSFAQHGMQLYNHGYGKSFVEAVTSWIDVFSNTPFEFPKDRIELMIRLLVDGNLKMGRFDEMDYAARGREIVRGFYPQKSVMSQYIDACKALLPYAEGEDKDFLAKFISDPLHFSECFNRGYSRLTYMTHSRPGFYASFRMAKRGLLGSEWVNSENTIGAFLSYGSDCYMKDGSEYDDIFPVWNWGCIPGTSSPNVELPTHLGSCQDTEFAGVLSDGLFGFAATDIKKSYTHDETVHFGGRKAVFFFDKQVVHLGNQLHCDSYHDYHTIVDQCYLSTDVVVDGSIIERSNEPREAIGRDVLHNGILYRVVEGDKLSLKNGKQVGSYTKLSDGPHIPSGKIEKDIFLLTIEHGVKVEEKSYAYIVFPNGAAEQAQIIKNAEAQAVFCDGRFCAVFYEDGECGFADMKISAKAGCMVMIHQNDIWVCADKPSEIVVIKAGCEKKITISSELAQTQKYSITE